ncbi:MAG: endonuclease V [Acidobacteria bacterium]|nr:endonuclease V [Acidobacteriota bacterium]
MIAAVDVGYSASALAAGVLFDSFSSHVPSATASLPIADVEPYVPGSFYRRELPCILALLQSVPWQPTILLIDGYVWLSEENPGLGAHVFEALRGPAVIGIAKTAFRGATSAISVLRGESRTPLYVSAAGIDAAEAAAHVQSMHGESRIPTMLRLVDRLSRGAILPEFAGR